MAEYIEREAVKEAIGFVHLHFVACGENKSLLDVINEIPAADVAPVVRCKDCEYYRVSAMLAPNKFCFRLKHPVEDMPIGYNFAPDDFCSHGKLKEPR